MKFEIDRIEIEGNYDTRRITPWDYFETVEEFKKGTPQILLPSWGQLDKIGDTDALWIDLNPYTVTIYEKNGRWRQFKFERGFIWDQASVPIFKNNVLEAIVAAKCHDANFSNHYMSFEDTNRLFFAMCRYYGMNLFRATYYYLAVNSMFGRARWENNQRGFWHNKTVSYMVSR